VSFQAVISPLNAISNYLLCSVSHSVNPFLSVSLSRSSTYSPLYLYHLSLFNIKGNQFCLSGIIEKLILTNAVFLSEVAHNTFFVDKTKDFATT
jgi:hypothetical protein